MKMLFYLLVTSEIDAKIQEETMEGLSHGENDNKDKTLRKRFGIIGIERQGKINVGRL